VQKESEVEAGATTQLVSPGLADEDGLRSAMLVHGGELFGFAKRALGDVQLAEEAVQETFVRAWWARGRFDPELGSLRSWLFTVERRIVIDFARARAVRKVEPLPAELESTDDELGKVLRSWQMEEAIQRLGPQHSHVLIETYFKGNPSRVVAAELAVPEGTIRSRLFYALKALRLQLEEMGWDE
jgi:RNA polymerase sigma-70 factor, ECF subfamily